MPRFERSLLLELLVASNKAGRLVDRAVDGCGIAADDFSFVSMVARYAPVTPTELARELSMSLSTVLFRANRSVDLGFLERISNPHDGRSFLLQLTTPKGEETWFRAARRLQQLVEEVEARLEHPSAELQASLRDLHDAFEAVLTASRDTSRR